MSWETVKLKGISLIQTGKLDSNAAVPNGIYPFFTCDPNTLSINTWAYDTEAILLAGNNASGNYTAKYYCGKFNAYQRTYIIESANKKFLNVRFLSYAMNQQLRLLKTMSSGSTTKFLTIRMLHDLDIPLPPIETQQRIADILSAYDNLIENNQKQIKLLEEAAQRLYKEWFVDLRFPGYESTPVVDGVPEGWSLRPLSEVFAYIRGKSYTSKELVDVGGTLMVNLKNIRAYGGYNRNAEKRFTGKYKDEQQLMPGDIVMGVTDMTQERRLVGHVAIAPDMGEPMTFSMDLIKLIPLSVKNNFLYATLFFGGYSKKISPLANGVNVLHLNPEAMMNMAMLIPSNRVIEQYDAMFEPYRQKIEKLQNQCNVSAEARDRLLPKLMSGEVEV